MSSEPEDRFAASDETLADAGADLQPAPDAARPWLAQQRFVHGMLRALHTADAGAREARVQAVMAALHRRSLQRRVAAAAAALLAAASVLWLLWPDPARM